MRGRRLIGSWRRMCLRSFRISLTMIAQSWECKRLVAVAESLGRRRDVSLGRPLMGAMANSSQPQEQRESQMVLVESNSFALKTDSTGWEQTVFNKFRCWKDPISQIVGYFRSVAGISLFVASASGILWNSRFPRLGLHIYFLFVGYLCVWSVTRRPVSLLLMGPNPG